MSNISPNIHIDGTEYAESRVSHTAFPRQQIDWEAPRATGGGIVGVVPPPPEQGAGPKLGSRRYAVPLGAEWDESSPSAIEEQRQMLKQEEKRRFESEVREVLKDIGRISSGQAVLDEVGRQHRQVTIIPYLPGDFQWNNGMAMPLDQNWTDATRKRWLLRDNDGEPRKDKDGDRSRGTGAGADAIIEFITPELMRVLISEFAVQVKWTAGGDIHTLAFADEILVHELVHAIRFMAGLTALRRVPRQPKYGTIEEFFAMVVANVYRSQCGRGGVRNNNHGGHETMYVSGENFLKLEFNRVHLRQFRRQHPQLFAALQEIDVYFNPFRHMRGLPD